jgi:hypothetical protein
MMNMRTVFSAIILAILLFAGLSTTSCKKFQGFSTGNLDFSKDTVVFDTVFTTIGSTTQRLKIYNNSNKTLNVDEIELVGGSNSPFRINVDGLKGISFANLEIEKDDSLFIFVEVTLQVNNATNPMVIEDKIRFRTNGKDQFIVLAVWGQDMYYHQNDFNSGVWSNDKPHLIYGFAGIDSAQTLTIEAGTQIFMHKNALIYNYKGTLNIEGTKNEKVVIQGDRLEQYYQDQRGQYYGIYMQQARPSTFRHVEIKNGTAGIHLFSRDPNTSGPTLDIKYSEIHNNSRYGIFIFDGAEVLAESCILHKNESHGLFVLGGGDFNFNNCNILSYGGSVAAVGITNMYEPNDPSQPTIIGNINQGTITNCAITGNSLTEMVINTSNPGGAVTLNFNIQRNLIYSEFIPTDSYFLNNIWNENPLFNNINEGIYTFQNLSPLNNSANTAFPSFFDFCENPRNISTPDIGAWDL